MNGHPEVAVPQGQPLHLVSYVRGEHRIGQVVAWKYQGNGADLSPLDCVPEPEVVGIDGAALIGFSWYDRGDDDNVFYASLDDARVELEKRKGGQA